MKQREEMEKKQRAAKGGPGGPARSGPARLAKGRLRGALLLGLLLTAAALCGCDTFDNFIEGLNQEETEEVVRIGIFEPMSGEDKEEGALEIQGIELAHELFPDALGKPVKLFYGDNKSDVTIAEDAARELVEERVAVALGSYTSTLSLVGGDVFEEAAVPAVGITCTNPLITKTNPYYARVCFVDSFQGNAAAKYVYECLNITQAAVLKQAENDYASAMAQQFSDKLAALTGNPQAVVKSVDYEKGAEDFSKQLEEIQASGVKTVYFPSEAEEALKVFQAAKGMGLSFIGTDKWGNDSFLADGGDAVEGAAYTAIYDAETSLTEMSALFLEAYAEKYGEDKKPESAVALGFDAYLVAREAINRAGTALSGGAIMAEMIKIRELPGATGMITLNSDGDPIKPVAISIVSGGAFVHKYTAEPVWGQ